MKHKLELIYFKMRALAEAPRLLLNYAEIEYDDLMSWDYYGKEWFDINSISPYMLMIGYVKESKRIIFKA